MDLLIWTGVGKGGPDNYPFWALVLVGLRVSYCDLGKNGSRSTWVRWLGRHSLYLFSSATRREAEARRWVSSLVCEENAHKGKCGCTR